MTNKIQLTPNQPPQGMKEKRMKNDMPVAAQIFLAVGLDKAPAIRRIAATVASRYWMEMHRYGEIADNCRQLDRLMKRFRLGDFIVALSVHYPIAR